MLDTNKGTTELTTLSTLGENIPNLICIGPRRCGTTWLGHMLTQDNRFGFWEESNKEPHIFSALIPRSLREGMPSGFERVNCVYRCDFTATYATFTRAEVEAVKRLSPNAKVIAGIRDPVERAISCLGRDRKYSKNDQARSAKGRDEYFRINAGMVRRENEYERNLSVWQSVFGENFLAFYFDEVKQQPEELLLRVTRFLDVRDFEMPKDISKPRNVSSDQSDGVEPHNKILLLRYWLKQDQPSSIEPNRFRNWQLAWAEQLATLEQLDAKEGVRLPWNVRVRAATASLFHRLYSCARWGRGLYRAHQLRRIDRLLQSLRSNSVSATID